MQHILVMFHPQYASFLFQTLSTFAAIQQVLREGDVTGYVVNTLLLLPSPGTPGLTDSICWVLHLPGMQAL